MQRVRASKRSIATIQQVAEKAGVSTATVSHVINETKKVHADTRQRVQAAIEALNYTQNPAARYLARGRVDIWGLLISDLRNPFFPELAAAFQHEVLSRDLDALIMNTDWHEGRTLAVVIAGGIVWFLIMTTLTLTDYITRGWLPFPGK